MMVVDTSAQLTYPPSPAPSPQNPRPALFFPDGAG